MAGHRSITATALSAYLLFLFNHCSPLGYRLPCLRASLNTFLMDLPLMSCIWLHPLHSVVTQREWQSVYIFQRSLSIRPTSQVLLAITEQRSREIHFARSSERFTPVPIAHSPLPHLPAKSSSLKEFPMSTYGVEGLTPRSSIQCSAVLSYARHGAQRRN